MGDENLNLILLDLQKQLKTAKIPVENLPVIARKGDESEKELKLVEKFLGESVFVRVPGENRTDLNGETEDILQSQFYIACFWGFRDIVRGMLDMAREKGTDLNVNAQNRGTHWTPLHAAAFQEHGPIIKLLLERGAQPELPDSEGRTPADFASASNKIWGHFSVLGLRRSPKEQLKQLGIIKKVDDGGHQAGKSPRSPKESGCGIRMASYSRPESAYAVSRDPFSAAAQGGDVLAAEDGAGAGGPPQLAAYKN